MISDVVIPIGDGVATEWACAACTFRNPPTTSICEICRTPNPTAQDPGADAQLIPGSPVFQRRNPPGDNNSNEAEQKKPNKNEITCPICMDNVLTDACRTINPCKHQVCNPCLKDYLEFEIVSGNVLDLHCPMVAKDVSCKSPLSSDLVKELVTEEHYQKFELFFQLKGDRTLRQCPKCDEIQQGDPKISGMICKNDDCKFAYCYFHGSAHVGGTCKEYKTRNKSVLRAAESFVTKQCMPCIYCKAPVQKSEGCNHMTCTQCKGEFCYLCGGKNRGGKHFQTFPPWNYLYGCAGLRMAENNKVHSRDTCCHRLFQGLCTFPFFIMLFISPFIFITLELVWCILVVGLCPIWCYGALCAICVTQDQEVVFDTMQPFFLLGMRIYYRYKYWWVGPDS